MDLDFPEEIIQRKNNEIIQRVLGKSALNISVKKFVLKEDIENQESNISCIFELFDAREKQINSIEVFGTGYGPVDAIFNAAIKELSKDYKSLERISFDDFSMKVNFKESLRWRKSDAPVEIRLVINGTRRIYFKAKSNSMVVAAIIVIGKALEYFINAELAVLRLSVDIKDANKRNRTDLMEKYTVQLSELVKIISYEGII